MSIKVYDPNRLLVMIQALDVYTSDLRREASSMQPEELEIRWKRLLDALYECFIYAQQHEVLLGEYKTELRNIIENLYLIEKSIKERKGKKPSLTNKFAEGMISIASKIDSILEGFGWKPVVRPITEAMFHIPAKVKQMLSSEPPKALPMPLYETYLPPVPLLPSPPPPSVPLQSAVISDYDDQIEWQQIEGKTKESYADEVLRKLRERVDRRLAEEDIQ